MTIKTVFRRRVLLLATLLTTAALRAQTPPGISPLDATTPSLNTPGAPADSYRLSSIEHFNPSNGHLNISIPLAALAGRGDANEMMTLPIESHWRVQSETYAYNCIQESGVPVCQYGTAFIPINEIWASDAPTWWSGVMAMRSTGDLCGQHAADGNGYTQTWGNTLTRLTFIGPDGTEHEFRDTQTNGLKQGIVTGANNVLTGYDRGTVFQAWDGSGAVFTSTSANGANGHVLDYPREGCSSTGGGGPPVGNGTLQLRNGTVYTVTNGYVTKIEDRNGNILNLPPVGSSPATITDGLGRQTIVNAPICYGSSPCVANPPPPTVTYPGAGNSSQTATIASTQSITYPGPGGVTQTVIVSYAPLSQLLMSGDPTHDLTGLNSLRTFQQLFASINWNCPTTTCPNTSTSTNQWAPNGLVAAVTYPNGQSYKFLYNSYGDVAEILLPTGGAYRYFYTNYFNSTYVPNGTPSPNGYELQRVLNEKDIYTNATDSAPSQVILYSGATSSNNIAMAGHVEYRDGSNNHNLLGSEDHYTYSVNLTPPQDGTAYKNWSEGKEFQVDYKDADGATVLRSEVSNWQQIPCSTCWWTNQSYNTAGTTPENNPRIVSKTTTIGTQVSEQDYAYDGYNNETERSEYDFGTSSHGPLIRKTCTTYQASPAGAYIVDLPLTRQIFNSSATCASPSIAPFAETDYTYDETAYSPSNITNLSAHDSNYSTNYTSRGNPTSVVEKVTDTVNGNVTLTSHYRYDIAGNITATLDPRGVEHDYAYNDSSNLYAFPTSIASYTALNSVAAFALPGAPPATGAVLTASVAYDYSLGKPTSTTDVNNNQTTYAYNDPLGRLTLITHNADNSTTAFVYADTPGAVNVQTATDQTTAGDGVIQSYVFYDGLGRQWETSSRAGSQVIDVCKTYDARNRVSFVSNPLYSRASFGSADTSSCSGLGTSYTYDGLNRQLTAAAADGSITTHKYAADATSHTNQALEIDPAQHNRLHYTDGAGRLTEVDENVTAWQNGTYGISGQSTYKTTYAYNALDNLTGVTQGQQSRSFTYDSLKRLVQAINPESGTIKYVYDNSGNLSKRTDANGSAMNGAYDGLNRVTSKAYVPAVNVAATPTVTYTYGDGAQPSGCAANTQSSNLKGRLTCVAAGTLVNNYTGYDWAGRVLAHSQVTNGTTYSMAYGYDLAGELNSFQFPSGRQQSISYDNGGRPSGVTGTYQSASTAYAKLAGNDANSQSYGYFPNGAVQYMGVGPNALAQQNCQNGLLQITGVRLASSGSLTGNCVNGTSPDILNLALTYGAPVSNNGNLSAEQITTNDSPTALNVTQQFYYDAYNRVSLATETPTSSAPAVSSGSTCANLGLVGNVWCQQYGYDAPGNRWVSTNWTSGSNGYPLSPFAPTQQSNYNGNNQLLTTNASTATYDFAGNQQSLGGFGFTWDAESRLTQSTINSASTSYLYDGEGRRVNKSTTNTGGTFNTVYVYDAKGELVAEYSNEAAQASGTEYLTEDHLGSTRLVTTATGGIIKRYDFLPFGEDLTQGIGGRGTNYNAAIAIGPTQDVVNNKFTGHQRDNETGLDYFGARYFSGAQGRFTSPDWSPIPQPIPYADLSDPQTLNLYSYVRNNPLSRTDPDGHCCEEVEDLGRQITMAAPHPLVKLGGYIIIGVGIVATALTSPDVRAAAADSLTFASQHGGKSAAQQDMDDLSGRTVEQQTGKASGRAEALNDAKRDAGVPTSQQPEKQANVPMTDANGKQVVLDGKPQTSREYTHTTGSGEKVVIQDHSQGHSFPDGSKVGPHINVRPQGDTRHGTVPGTQPHYPYKKHGEN